MNHHDTEISRASLTQPTSKRASAGDAMRLAIIGCSLGRSRYHLAIQACPDIRIAGIADSDERATRIWTRDIGNRVPAYVDVPALLAAAHSFDALLIASPLALRETHLRAALALGKPILAEVPFALKLESVTALALAARNASSLLMPTLPRPLDPWFDATTAQLHADTIGKLHQIRCHWSFPIENIENVDATEDQITGGWNGLIQTLGSQTADLARRWMGNALSVSGDIDLDELRQNEPPSGQDRQHRQDRQGRQHRRPADRSLANLIVTHEQGQSTHHFSRTRSVQPDERYLFTGTTGNLELIITAGATAASATAPALTLQRPGQRPQNIPVKPEPVLVGKTPLSASTARIVNMLNHFVHCVRTGAPPAVTADDARSALEILHAGYLSTNEHVKVILPLVRPPDIARMLASPELPRLL